MINSSIRKLILSGWLNQNGKQEYDSPLKLQKFLFFYELFSKIDGEKPDFNCLRGYMRGPVYSSVWGDYTKERSEFNKEASKAYRENKSDVDVDRAKRSKFLVSTLSENELSELTHRFNIWKSQEDRIKSGERNVALKVSDLNAADLKIAKTLEMMYPIEMIDNSKIIKVDNRYYVISEDDEKKLSQENYDTLYSLANNKELNNPVFVKVDEKGVLLID